MLTESGARHVLYDLPLMNDLTQVERIVITWPSGSTVGDIRAVRLDHRKVYVLADNTLFEGVLPATGPYGRGVSSTITAVLIVFAVTLGFGILKRFAR